MPKLLFAGALIVAFALSLSGWQPVRTASAGGPDPSINVIEYCVDSSAFHFTVDLADVPLGGFDDVAFRIGADGYSFSAPIERFSVNFAPSNGSFSYGPLVETIGSAPYDRWADGSVADFALNSLGSGGWRLEGSYGHGSQPFTAGDSVADTELRTFLGDVFVLKVAITACEPEPEPTPSPTPSPTPPPEPTPTPTPTSTPAPSPTPTAEPTPSPTPAALGVVQEPEALPSTGGTPAGGAGGMLWIVLGLGAALLSGGGLYALYAVRIRRG